MRTIRSRAAPFAISVAFAAVVLCVACSSDNAVPTTSGALGSTRDAGDIYGYVAGDFGSIEGAYVAWYCTYQGGHVLIGKAWTDDDGYYHIGDEPFWSEHQGHDFVGEASAPGYETGYAYIYGYNGTREYRKDFYLETE